MTSINQILNNALMESNIENLDEGRYVNGKYVPSKRVHTPANPKTGLRTTSVGDYKGDETGNRNIKNDYENVGTRKTSVGDYKGDETGNRNITNDYENVGTRKTSVGDYKDSESGNRGDVPKNSSIKKLWNNVKYYATGGDPNDITKSTKIKEAGSKAIKFGKEHGTEIAGVATGLGVAGVGKRMYDKSKESDKPQSEAQFRIANSSAKPEKQSEAQFRIDNSGAKAPERSNTEKVVDKIHRGWTDLPDSAKYGAGAAAALGAGLGAVALAKKLRNKKAAAKK